MRVLVTYASKHGATQGIADRIGEDLRSDGHQVDVRPASRQVHPEEYDAVVVGSAAYAMHWMRDATSFVSGPLGEERVDAEGHDVATASLPKETAELAELHPRDHHVFWGALDFSQLGLTGRMLKKLPATRDAIPEGDFRDWDDVDRWAHRIAEDLERA